MRHSFARAAALLAFSLLLGACSNLTAQLLGNDREFTYTMRYTNEGEGVEHTLTAAFTVHEGKVVALEITPGARDAERGRQLAFSANVRSYVLDHVVSAIALPDVIGEEQQITRSFDEQVIARLKENAGS